MTNLIKKTLTNLIKKTMKPTEPTAHPTPEQTPYQLIGGEAATRDLANRFYDIMETDSKAAALLAIHPGPMPVIREKFFEFLSGWLGGPGLYIEKYGHPKLRARHLPFAIDDKLKQQWMYCMGKALDHQIDNPLLRAQLRQSFDQLAAHMINQP